MKYYTSTSSTVNLKSNVASANNSQKKRARDVIKKIAKRIVSFEIADIKQALQMAENPEMPDRSRLHQIYRYISRDGHLKSQIRNAKFEVLSEPWMMYRDGKPDENATKLLQKLWFNAIIEYIFEAELHGYSLVEADEINKDDDSKVKITLIDRDYVSIEKQWILIDGTINGSYLPYGDIKQELDLLEFGRPDDLGILLECAYNVIWKYYARSDWSRGSEKFGMPILSIEADTINDDELNAIENRAANFGNDGYIILQAGDKASIIERKSDKGHDIFKDNIALCNDEISKIINGQSTTSDQKSFVGSAEVGERTMQTFTIARLQRIADECNKSVVPYLVAKGFPIDGLKFDYPELIRQRDKKLNGPAIPEPTDPAPAPQPQPEPKPKPKPKTKVK